MRNLSDVAPETLTRYPRLPTAIPGPGPWAASLVRACVCCMFSTNSSHAAWCGILANVARRWKGAH